MGVKGTKWFIFSLLHFTVPTFAFLYFGTAYLPAIIYYLSPIFAASLHLITILFLLHGVIYSTLFYFLSSGIARWSSQFNKSGRLFLCIIFLSVLLAIGQIPIFGSDKVFIVGGKREKSTRLIDFYRKFSRQLEEEQEAARRVAAFHDDERNFQTPLNELSPNRGVSCLGFTIDSSSKEILHRDLIRSQWTIRTPDGDWYIDFYNASKYWMHGRYGTWTVDAASTIILTGDDSKSSFKLIVDPDRTGYHGTREDGAKVFGRLSCLGYHDASNYPLN